MTPSKWARRMEGDPRADFERQQAERQAIRRELHRELELARDRREPWIAWIDARADGIHLHELRRETGERISCPVAGCDAVMSERSSARRSDAPARPAEPRQLSL